ncbi:MULTISPECIES: AMP-binding protein [unclassified Brevibacterium]|uniref:class I adenylate-forming enzyme family protein n=1 Tax=unclassified Brevibacterium TaxID=2614124 RepID=UPI0010F6559A|nr:MULTISPECIES: AMP-binding protein [unclassified Brevibacterium]MCM1013976.1 AMP-binding protein [Brevibacterium sp. XM4083]
MSSWFDTRPWMTTWGDIAPTPHVLDTSTTLRDLAATVAAHGDEVALTYFGFAPTWAEFDRYSTAFAAYLSDQGIAPGDRVGIYDQNTPAFMIATYGIWKAGGVVVPLNPMYRGELEHVFSDAEVRALVVSKAAYLDRVRPFAADIPTIVLADDRSYQVDGPEKLFGMFDALPGTPGVSPEPGAPDHLGGPDFQAVVGAYLDSDFTPVDVAPEDEALVVYTSGTSGRSKGASGTHAAVSSNSRYNMRNSWFEPGDGYLTLAPIFHITGFICQFIAAVSGGARLILNYRFEPESFLGLIVRERPTYMAGPATVYTAMLAHPAVTADHFSSFKRVMSGGAPLPEGLVTKFKEKLGIDIGQGYGLTETMGQAVSVPYGLQAPVDPDSGNLSCGLPQPDTMVRILDDSGEPVGPGELGEVAISGPEVASEYINNPTATSDQIPAGELRTGDVGYMNEDGWLFIVDRKKDMINASGYKVWPREVEDVLYTHPAIQEAAVVGVPDEYRGEDVAAFVTLQPGAEATREEIIAYCRDRLASFKAPHQVTFVDELPKTSSGKILRRTIRADAAEAAQAATEAASGDRGAAAG